MKESVQTQQKGLVGKYYPYPEYKDSGVEWLGEVPSEWIATRLKFIASINMGQSPNSEDCNDLGIGNPFLQGNAEFGQRSPTPKQYCDSAKKNANVGDFLFSVRAPVGAVNIADQRYGIGRGLCAIRSHEDIAHLYLWWVLQTSKIQFDAISTGSTFEAVSSEQVCNFALAIPSKYEQHTIATFLDYETARIDRLIAQQQRLIELLKDKRQAVISHAVTKGLNPSAPMKDSGVEWLGQVPEHWAIPQIGYLCNVTKLTGFEYTNYWEPDDSGEIIALRGYNIGERILDLEKKTEKISRKLSKKLARTKLHQGDVVMPCTGTLGNAAVIPKSDTFHINQNIAKLTFSDVINPDYACYWVTSNNFRRMIDHNNTSGMQPVLLIGDIRNMRIPVPPSIEQSEIVCYLKRKTAKFEAVIENGFKLLSLLQERRTALISAAVTGKIDLRGWTPPAEEAAT